ncbi:MAG: MarR family transcriptional regulator [bacterium]|nr:MarR family transcriptional regulator [bacterium]
MTRPKGSYELDALLRDLAADFRAMSRQVLAGFEVTPLQYHALLLLSRAGQLTMGDLCDRMLLASSTVTDLVDRMEKGGYVARERCHEDRRVVRLQLTDRGRRVVDEMLRTRLAKLDSLLESMSPGDQERLLDSLRQLHGLLRTPAGGSATP